MAITVVESGSNDTINGGTVTNTFVNALQENDLVILAGGHPRPASSAGPLTAGYTEVVNSSNGSSILSVSYKFMTSTPDTDVSGAGSGNNLDAVAYAYIVLRGVDTTTPQDAVAVVTTGTGAVDLNGITTNTNGAVVLACLLKNAVGIASAGPTGYSSFTATSGNDTNDADVALAVKEVATAGVEDPDAFSGITGAQDWTGATLAFKPAAAGSASQGTLSKTLENLGLSATGALSLSAVLSKTLEDLSLSSAGSLAISGVLTKTLAALTLVASGVGPDAEVAAEVLTKFYGMGPAGKTRVHPHPAFSRVKH